MRNLHHATFKCILQFLPSTILLSCLVIINRYLFSTCSKLNTIYCCNVGAASFRMISHHMLPSSLQCSLAHSKPTVYYILCDDDAICDASHPLEVLCFLMNNLFLFNCCDPGAFFLFHRISERMSLNFCNAQINLLHNA